jgi:hypothetical protein
LIPLDFQSRRASCFSSRTRHHCLFKSVSSTSTSTLSCRYRPRVLFTSFTSSSSSCSSPDQDVTRHRGGGRRERFRRSRGRKEPGKKNPCGGIESIVLLSGNRFLSGNGRGWDFRGTTTKTLCRRLRARAAAV